MPINNVLEDCIYSIKSNNLKDTHGKERSREKVVMRGLLNERRVEKA